LHQIKPGETRNIILAILVIITVQVIYWLYANPMPIVMESHFLAGRIVKSGANIDISREIYGFLKTPIYYFLSDLYSKPYLFILTSFLVNIAFPIALFYFVYHMVRLVVPSVMASMMLSPLSIGILNKVPYLNLESISVRTLYGFGDFILSVRTINGFISIFILYAFVSKKYNLFYSLLILSFFVHPNSSVLMCIVLIAVSTILALNKKIKPSVIIGIAISGVIGVIPTLYSLYSFPSVDNLISNAEWYLNMINDEADDFSILYQIAYKIESILSYLILLTATYIGYSRIQNKHVMISTLWLLTLTPLLLFIFLFALEYFSVYYNNMTLIRPIISFQPGHKLLSYSYIPMIAVWGWIFSGVALLGNNNSFILKSVLGFLILFLVVIIIPFKGNIVDQYNYFHKVRNYDSSDGYLAYLDSRNHIKDSGNPSIPPIYDMSEVEITHYENQIDIFHIKKLDENQPSLVLDEEYMEHYNKFIVLKGLVMAIKENVNLESGIIMPPYMQKLRDLLVEYDLFFQEKHDGNLMMGSRNFATILLDRMKALIGMTYNNIPGRNTGLIYTLIRQEYLSIDEEMLMSLKRKYPRYNVFVTEAGHNLDLKILYKDKFYIIYSF
tara:strand:- start:2203 stop:4038 length:1836 start_codon:yes stop_codon:yes gene_type:complete